MNDQCHDLSPDDGVALGPSQGCPPSSLCLWLERKGKPGQGVLGHFAQLPTFPWSLPRCTRCLSE